ncbi:MAG: glutamate-5-semialdehyde dehydrogenase, partial [Pseudomonadota bacterium]
MNYEATTVEQTRQALATARSAARKLVLATPAQLAEGVERIAEQLRRNHDRILTANQLDLKRKDPADPRYDRLLLNPDRIDLIADDLDAVAALPCPLDQVLERRTLDNGLQLEKIRVALGVVAVIYESRPNVTADVSALCLKSGNVALLKGSRDAADSNRVLVDLIHHALTEAELPPAAVTLAPSERDALPVILDAVGQVDVAIPRGSQGLINAVRENARIPVIETGAGIVHVYVDESASIRKARAIVTNSKARRVSVCNALDTLVLHESRLADLPELLSDL